MNFIEKAAASTDPRHTAWAGEGDGVLFFDPNGSREITESGQCIFAEWDPVLNEMMIERLAA